MGEVKDKVKGTGAPSKSVGGSSDNGNLLQQVQIISDEVSRLTALKDDDVLTEGDTAKPENVRKAATLRAAGGLLRHVKNLLEDY